MKLLLLFVLVCIPPGFAAQEGSQPSPKHELTTQIERGHELHVRAERIVQAEDARAKEPLCPKAMTTLDINQCYSNELGTTDANYGKLARTLGLLLRAGDSPKTIPFDDAENAWHTYRKLACKAAGGQYEGGTIRPSIEMGCQITVTRSHMDELWAIYNDLGTR